MTQYASVNNKPPLFGREYDSLHKDEGQGIPNINQNDMTVEDIYKSPFIMFDAHHPKDHNSLVKESRNTLQCHSDLSKMFYASKNIVRIQKMIKEEIKIKTNGKFKLDTDQDPEDVRLVMSAVFTQYARHRPGEVVRQIKLLNKKVVDTVVPDMLEVIQQAYGYLLDIDRPLQPNRLPVNVNSRGRNTLPSVTTTFGY